MCGFLGFLTSVDNYDTIDRRFISSLNLIANRGPDSEGSFKLRLRDSIVKLGHRRLAIIDTSNAANQPYTSSCNNYAIVFNGEIYNYIELREELKSKGFSFNTESDTEVLLYAWQEWGIKCLPRLVGMFSFAVIDKKKSKLTFVRDAFGIKPFYFSKIDKGLYFGSDLRSIISLSNITPKPNLQRAVDYLVYGLCDISEDSFVDGIKHLPPGHWLEFNLNNISYVKSQPWWEPNLVETSKLSFNQAASKVRELFLESLEYHLRSDVPLAAALSGGIDSSAVVCCMRRLRPHSIIHTFSYISNDHKSCEEKWIDKINNFVSAVPHKVYSIQNRLEDDLDDLILTQGEPFTTTSMYAQRCLFQAVNKCGIKVTLDGQGADEVLAGYIGYPGYRLLSLLEEKRLIAAIGFCINWSKWPNRSFLTGWMHLVKLILPRHLNRFANIFLGRKHFPRWINAKYLRKHDVSFFEPKNLISTDNKGKRVREALATSLQQSGLPALLRYADRNSMAFSIESRVPFLSLPLVDFLLSLPEDYLISYSGQTKSIFRAAMRGIVPDSHLDRKDKIGFETSEFEILRNSAPQLIKWVEQAPEISFINKKSLISDLRKSFSTSNKYSPLAWRALNYLRWYTLILEA